MINGCLTLTLLLSEIAHGCEYSNHPSKLIEILHESSCSRRNQEKMIKRKLYFVVALVLVFTLLTLIDSFVLSLTSLTL